MTSKTPLSDIRREYGQLSLSHEKALVDPAAQFGLWLEEIIKTDNADPTAMVVSTVDAQGIPDSRVVLLKGLDQGRFIFYTNYTSTKAQQLQHNQYVALNFYWPALVRQVRIRGIVEKTEASMSDEYFASRPFTSQISALASPQSQVIKSRQILKDKYQQLQQQYHGQKVIRPDDWGGYAVMPFEYEFWQGRDNRLHERLRYRKQQDEHWIMELLAP